MDYHSFRFADLTAKARMKLVKGSVIPRPIAWVTSRNTDGTHNLAPFSYFNMLSSSVLAIAFTRQGEVQKDTARNILREREAVVHIGDRSLIEALDLSSAELPENESEVDLTGLTLIPSAIVGVDSLAEAKIRLEASLEQHLELMNYEGSAVESDLILLRVQAVHVRDDIFDAERGYILHGALDPLARLGGPYYSTIEEVEGFERQF